MDFTSIRAEILKFYEERIGDYDRYNIPPWAKRKSIEVARSLAHPDILSVLGVLNVCSRNSVLRLQQLLRHYLTDTYGLSDEIAETWILFFSTRDLKVLDRFTQMDPIRFYSDLDHVAGSNQPSQRSYAVLQQNKALYKTHLDLHIGSHATQEDVIWFIKRYWNEEFRKQYFVESRQQKRNKKFFRQSTIYYLHIGGKSVREIQEYVNAEFGDFVEEPNIRKVIKEFTPPRDWFVNARQAMRDDMTIIERATGPVYDLQFDEATKSFTLKKNI